MNPDNAGWIKRVKETASFEEMAVVLREWLATIEAMKINHIPKPPGFVRNPDPSAPPWERLKNP